MSNKEFSDEDARDIGERIGIDWQAGEVDLDVRYKRRPSRPREPAGPSARSLSYHVVESRPRPSSDRDRTPDCLVRRDQFRPLLTT